MSSPFVLINLPIGKGDNQPLETKGTSLDGDFLSFFFKLIFRALDATF